jgi:hypothetical protein
MKHLRQAHVNLLANSHGFRFFQPCLVPLRSLCTYNGKGSHDQLVRWRMGNSYGPLQRYWSRPLSLDPKSESAKKISVEIQDSGVAILTMQVRCETCRWFFFQFEGDDDCADPSKVCML